MRENDRNMVQNICRNNFKNCSKMLKARKLDPIIPQNGCKIGNKISFEMGQKVGLKQAKATKIVGKETG